MGRGRHRLAYIDTNGQMEGHGKGAFHSNANLCKNDASCKTLMSYCDLLLVSKWLKFVSSSCALIEVGLPDVYE